MEMVVVKSPHGCMWRSVYFKEEGQQRKGTRGKIKKKILCPLVFSPLLSRLILSIIFTSSSAQLEFMHSSFSFIPKVFFRRASAVWFQNFAIRKVIKGHTQFLQACFRHGFVSSSTERERVCWSHIVEKDSVNNVPLAWFALTSAFNSK